MKKKIALIFSTALITLSCNSKSHNERDLDSSRMTDSAIMNRPDTLNRGFDTAVIDTPKLRPGENN